MTTRDDREQAAEGARLLQRLVPAPDKGPGWRRDSETGFLYYSSDWLWSSLDDNVVEGHELKAVK